MDVIHAAYSAVAVVLAEKYSPDCILVDTEAGPLSSVVIDEIINDPIASSLPVILLTNDDALYDRYRSHVSGRVKRGFRKSGLLSGIHYALSKGVSAGERLGPKILCVDDDPEIVKFMTRCLENEGYEAGECATGEEALELVKTGEYWLVLLDISMPGMDGGEVFARLREDPETRMIPVCIVSGKPELIGLIYDKPHRPPEGYLDKPVEEETLVRNARKILELARKEN